MVGDGWARGEQEILRLDLVGIIWLIQFGCKDAWTVEFADNFGWSVKTKSVQEELFVCIWVGSLINCENPFKDVSKYDFVLSEVLISPDH